MLSGATVGAAVITVLLAPSTMVSGVLTFAIVMVAAVVLSYVVGYLGTPWTSTATPSTDTSDASPSPSEATQADIEEFKWAIREGIGVAIASLFGLLLLILFLIEQTEWVTTREFNYWEIGEWFLITVLAIALIALALWSWRGR
ncbi:hypothetical protein GWG54_00570 [Natronococcus sp. JC468]|nr:hypothetical protein [Natronococcus sp. JC468]